MILGARTVNGKRRTTKRLAQSRFAGLLVIELTEDSIILRPLKTRRGGPAEVEITAGALYDRLLMQAAVERKKAKKRKQ